VEPSVCWRNLVSLVIITAFLGVAPPFGQSARADSNAEGASQANEKEIREATTLFYDALNSALQGDLGPLGAVWSHRPDVSDLGGVGGRAIGWNEVRNNFQNLGRLYPAGKITPQDTIVVVDGDMGYSVCNETGRLRSAEGPMVNFNRRATNIFRREDGKWKLVHHHADTTVGLSQSAPQLPAP
jgi:ketosteroid isomerase-like protein